MAFNFNGNTPKKILFNGLSVAKLVFNGVAVWLEKVLTTITGFPIVLTNCTGEDLVDYKIEGNSVQKVKNIFPIITTPQTFNGITLSYDETDNTFVLNGTSTASKSFEIITVGQNYEEFKKDDSYTLSAYVVSGSTNTNYGAYIYIKDSYTNSNYVQKTVEGVVTTPYVFTYNGNGYINRIAISISNAGHTYENYKFKIQLEKGVSATEIEPYIEPTPYTPVEIESVGEKTSNLFNNDISVTNISKEGNDLIVKAYASGTGIKPSQFLEMTGLKIGDKFTIKRSFTVEKGTASTVTGAIRFLKADGSSDYFGLIGGSDKVKTVTIPENFNDDTYSYLYFYGVSTAENGERLVRFSNIQIVKGSYTTSTMPEYEPYNKYKIPIIVKGKNLFDDSFMYKTNRTSLGITWNYDEETKSYIANGTQTAQLSSYALFTNSESIVNNLKNGHKYMLCGNSIPDVENTRYYVFATHKSGTKSAYVSSDLNTTNCFIWSDGDTLSPDIRIYSTDGVFREIKNARFQPMLIDVTNMSDEEIANIKAEFEEYIEPITTNIYLDEPLRKIDDYNDYIDFEKGKVFRDIAYKKITASSITQKSSVSTENFNYYFISFSGAMVGREIPILSNIGGYPNKQLNDKNREGIFSNTNTTFFIAFFDITTLADAKQFVTDNEVYVNYILATPKEETIELPNIPTHKGTTIIELDTEISPSNMEVKYYRK